MILINVVLLHEQLSLNCGVATYFERFVCLFVCLFVAAVGYEAHVVLSSLLMTAFLTVLNIELCPFSHFFSFLFTISLLLCQINVYMFCDEFAIF